MQAAFMIADWHIVPASGQIYKGDTEHRLEPKAMAVLVYLAEHAGEVVTREELEQSVWQGSIVTYEALTVTINKIRAVLGDDSRNPRFIETLAKRGYRLIAPVTRPDTHPQDPPAPARDRKRFTRLLPLALLILIGGILFVTLSNQYNPHPDNNHEPLHLPEDAPSIAVIPFSNISGDPAQDYFAAGMTEYLITDLSRLSSLLVTSRSSVMGFNSNNVDIKNVSQALHVQYVLTGSVVKNKNRLRVAVQLTDAANGVQLWADRFDRSLDDLFAVQDEISNKIITALVSQVASSDQQLRSHNYTNNHEAHDYYIRGNALYTSITKEGNTLAREMFLKAIEVDPDFASAYSAIALTYIDDYRRKWGKQPADAVNRAFDYAQQAINVDNNAAVAHWVLAYAWLYGRRDPHKAIDAAKQAIKLYPNYADAYAIIGSSYSFIGRSTDAIRINRHAMRLNPTSSFVYFANLGRDYYFLQEHDKAIESLESAIFRNENYLNAHLYLAATYASLDQLDDASWETEKVLILDPEFSLNYWSQTQPYTSRTRLERMVADLRKAGLPD
jgi:adenylate cyclase